MDTDLLDLVVRGELDSFPVLRNAGVTGFQSSSEYSSRPQGCRARGVQSGDRSAWRGLAFWEGGSWHADVVHLVLASLPRAHHSSLPAPPSASGRPRAGGSREITFCMAACN